MMSGPKGRIFGFVPYSMAIKLFGNLIKLRTFPSRYTTVPSGSRADCCIARQFMALGVRHRAKGVRCEVFAGRISVDRHDQIGLCQH